VGSSVGEAVGHGLGLQLGLLSGAARPFVSSGGSVGSSLGVSLGVSLGEFDGHGRAAVPPPMPVCARPMPVPTAPSTSMPANTTAVAHRLDVRVVVSDVIVFPSKWGWSMSRPVDEHPESQPPGKPINIHTCLKRSF
jgi:hypothetical protein